MAVVACIKKSCKAVATCINWVHGSGYMNAGQCYMYKQATGQYLHVLPSCMAVFTRIKLLHISGFMCKLVS